MRNTRGASGSRAVAKMKGAHADWNALRNSFCASPKLTAEP